MTPNTKEYWTPPRVYRSTHPLHRAYELFPGDLLNKDSDGTWTKHAPGLCLMGFVLSDAEERDLNPIVVQWHDSEHYVVVQDPMIERARRGIPDPEPPKADPPFNPFWRQT